MAQFLRPVAVRSNSGFTTHLGSTVGADIVAALDETVADTADYIQSATTGTSEIEIELGTGADPSVDTGFILRYGLDREGANSVDAYVRLIQGTDTTIAEWYHSEHSTTATVYEKTLTSTEAARITDFTDLFVEAIKYDAPGSWEDLGAPSDISGLTDAEAKTISGVQEFNGRVYIGYGDYDSNIPVGGTKILYWDVNTEAFVDSGEVLTGYGTTMRLMDDELWMLVNDMAVGTHMSYFTIDSTHTITERNFGSQIMGYHLLDALYDPDTGAKLLCGAGYEDADSSNGGLWRWNGTGWTQELDVLGGTETSGYRIYTMMKSAGYIWAKSHLASTYRSNDGGDTWSTIGIALPGEAAGAINLPGGNALCRSGHWPPAKDSSVWRLKGDTASAAVVFNAFDGNGIANTALALSPDGRGYGVFDDGTLRMFHPDGATLITIADDLPTNVSALCVTTDMIYIGTFDSHIWRRARTI